MSPVSEVGLGQGRVFQVEGMACKKELRLERSVETKGLRNHIKEFISWRSVKNQ